MSLMVAATTGYSVVFQTAASLPRSQFGWLESSLKYINKQLVTYNFVLEIKQLD